jgi:hypothetical protein
MVVGAAAIITLVAVVAYFVISGWGAESTDDAYVTAHLTTVIAKVPAYVQTLHIDDNAAVKAGELLVELDPRDYAVEVEIARANLDAAAGRRKEADDRVGIADADAAQARAELTVAHANATLAEANLKRLRSVSDAPRPPFMSARCWTHFGTWKRRSSLTPTQVCVAMSSRRNPPRMPKRPISPSYSTREASRASCPFSMRSDRCTRPTMRSPKLNVTRPSP